MKNTRRLLAVLLVLAMVLSCLPMSILAADKSATADTASAASQKAKLGFKSTSFRENNSYRYAADESVRAIVVMDGKPAAEATQTRAVVKAKLAAQHNALRKSMSNISYTELFEYDSLLNGLAVETAYGNLDAISEMPGVKAVYIANHYDTPRYDANMEFSNEMTGLSVAHLYDYAGSGTVIAVLDTGMAAGHEAFAVYEGMLENAALSKEDAEAYIAEIGRGKYVSEKIPFSYDYADVDDNAEDSTNGHGVHVSGIAAGYAEDPDGAITFVGAAPDAQLLEMKIFNDVSEGTSSDIYYAALEDAYELGADVINMSIGAPNGFTYDPELDSFVNGNIFKTLEEKGVVCSVSAGNEGSMADNASNWAGTGFVTADYADYGVTGSPATYDGNMSIASLENVAYPTTVLKVGALTIPYYDSDEEGQQFYNAMAGKQANFVDCGFGYVEDFEKVDVTGKIALISRGDITFQEKVDNAGAAGAIAAIVYNNADGIIYMSIDPYAVPAATISQADGKALLALLNGEAGGIPIPAFNVDSKPAKRGGEETTAIVPVVKGDKTFTAAKRAIPATGSCVVLYNPAAEAILGYEEDTDYDETTESYTYWNILASDATVNGTELRTAYMTAGTVYAVDNKDGTWSFIDQYDYDDSEAIYPVASDTPDTYYSNEWDETASYIITEVEGGYTLQNQADGSYLCIHDGAVYSEVLIAGDASFVWQFAAVEDLEGTTASDAVYVCTILDGENEIPTMGKQYKLADEIADGEYLIVNKEANKAMSNDVVEGGGKNYRAGADVAPVDGIITTDDAALVWDIEATEGGYYIKNADGDTLSCTTGLDFAETDNVWAIEKQEDGTYFITSTTAKGTQGDAKVLEWYAQFSEFSTHYPNETNANLFAMDFYALFDGIIIDEEAPIMTFPAEMVVIANTDAWLMSDFSSWGCTPSLTLKPTITGVGGDVWSAAYNTEDGYVLYSGTSMAAPNVTGFMAVLLSYLMAADAELSKVDRAAKAEALAQSTAAVLEDAEGYPYSPRKQGAGLIDAVAALSTDAYITEPIQNLFDSADGVFEFDFTVKNDGEAAMTYDVTPVAMYDFLASDNMGTEEEPDIHFYNTLTSDYLEIGNDCTVDAPETVTVPAGGTADVKVKITLTEDCKERFDAYYPNGNFIEGYVFLTPQAGHNIHATYMGFYGDWTKAPAMEQHDWREIVDIDTWLATTAADEDGNTYADYGYTYLDVADFEINTDINIAYALNYAYLEQMGGLMGGYAGDNLFAYADFNEKHIAISEGEDGICDTLYMIPMNLRNVRHMVMVVSDAETGEVYYVDDTEYLPKVSFDDDNGYWSNSGLFIWDGTDAEGEALASDTVVDVNYYCNLAYGEDALGAIDYADMKTEAADYLEWGFQCTVDNDAPTFTYEYDEETETLTVTASDNQYLAYIALYQGDEEIASEAISEDEAGKTAEVVFKNIPGDAFYELDVADYASNIAVEQIIVGEVETAKVRFVIPEGFELDGAEVEFEVPVGSTVVMPKVDGEVDGGYFVAWLNTPIEEPIPSEALDTEEYEWIWDEMLFEDDEALIEEDTVFYALMERPTGYYDPHEELACSMGNQDDWSGIWAIDGYDWTVTGDEDTYDYLLSADLSTFALEFDNEEEYISYGFFGEGYLTGALDEHLFTIEKIGADESDYGIYTIKNNDGKYIAMNDDGALTLAEDTSDVKATWSIWFEDAVGCNVMMNRGVEYVLMFNEDTSLFGSVAFDEAEIDEPHNLYLYGPSAEDYEYYTAAAKDPCEGYTDIDRNAWYHKYADFVIANGLMGSTSTAELVFEPDTSCNRAMLVTILYSLEGKPEVAYEAKFSDVPDGKWFTKPVMWALQNGVVTGYEDSTFRPNNNITREETAVVLKAYAEKVAKQDTSKAADLNTFPDAGKVTWSKAAMSWAVAEGLISGNLISGTTYLDPQGQSLRCQMAVILMKFLSK